MTPQEFQTRPLRVEAMRFLDALTAGVIIGWTHGAGRSVVQYIAEGHESQYRRGSELDRSNGHTLDTAPEFLIVWTSDLGDQRLDLGGWVVRDAGEFRPWTNDDFTNRYEETA